MKKTFWIATVFAIILVVFSVQNAKDVTVKFFFKDVSISLAVLLICVFIFGAVTGASYFFFLKVKDKKKQKTVTEKDIAKAGPIMITGIPGHAIEGVVLEDIEISYPGAIDKDIERLVPEDETRYPEQYFFGILPAWGAYIRHAKNIEFKNVKMTLRAADARQKIVLDDVEGFIEK